MARRGDLSMTALYTSGVWTWARLSHAHLFATIDAKRVFDATNAALGIASVLKRGHAPLRHSLLHRHEMIDHLLRASGVRTVIELAAGLSRRGAAVTEDPRVRYTEIDLPHVIERKRELLQRSAEGKAVLARPGLQLIAADVETVELEAYRVRDEPVFVIAEGLMMYLPAVARRALFAKIRRLGDVRLVFDLVPTSEQAPPGVTGRVLEAAMKRFTRGRSFERDARTRDDIIEELAGWDPIEAIASTDVAHAWKLAGPDLKTEMVVFSAVSRATPP